MSRITILTLFITAFYLREWRGDKRVRVGEYEVKKGEVKAVEDFKYKQVLK